MTSLSKLYKNKQATKEILNLLFIYKKTNRQLNDELKT